MGKVADLTGKTFGRLTVLGLSDLRKNGSRTWDCKCSCGNTSNVPTNKLNSGQVKSCGCYQKDRASETSSKDLTGKKFGQLTVLEKSSNRTNDNGLIWKCRCSCGVVKEVSSSSLVKGSSKSCGCLKSIAMLGNTISTKHGGIKEAPVEYDAWKALGENDLRPTEWDDFVQFFCDVGERTSPKHILSRRDARLPHSKENTYWKDRNAEREVYNRLTTFDLPEECTLDLRSILRSTATT